MKFMLFTILTSLLLPQVSLAQNETGQSKDSKKSVKIDANQRDTHAKHKLPPSTLQDRMNDQQNNIIVSEPQTNQVKIVNGKPAKKN
jgi:hypothetical protein